MQRDFARTLLDGLKIEWTPRAQQSGARLRLFRGGARPSLGGALPHPRRGLLGLVIGGLLLLVFDQQPKQPDRQCWGLIPRMPRNTGEALPRR